MTSDDSDFFFKTKGALGYLSLFQCVFLPLSLNWGYRMIRFKENHSKKIFYTSVCTGFMLMFFMRVYRNTCYLMGERYLSDYSDCDLATFNELLLKGKVKKPSQL